MAGYVKTTLKTGDVKLTYVAVNTYHNSQVMIAYYCIFSMCSDYNLCEKCVSRSDKIHDKKHLFVKIPHPLKPDVVEDKILLPGEYVLPLKIEYCRCCWLGGIGEQRDHEYSVSRESNISSNWSLLTNHIVSYVVVWAPNLRSAMSIHFPITVKYYSNSDNKL